MQSIINEPKPHFYEYMEIQLLQSYMRKGISYFVNSLANSSTKLLWLRYQSDQIGLIVDFVKDFLCLSKYGATYAEQFYGLQRADLSQETKGRKWIKVFYHTIVTTVIPYVLQKIDTYYNNILEQQQNQGRILNRIQKLFTTLYPYLHMISSALQVFMKFSYLLDKKQRTFDLYYKISRTRLTYKKHKMMMGQQDKVHYPWMDLVKTPGLLSIIIGHKLLTWYFTQKSQKGSRMNAGERKISQAERYTAPLSMIRNDKVQGVKERRDYTKGLCLVCSKSISNPTVVKQNGHVFCYNCISQYVRQNGKCPITGISLKQENLQMVYSTR